MVLEWLNVIDEHGITNRKKFNIFAFSLSGAMGLLMGIFFTPYFFFKTNLFLLAVNLIALVIGVISLIYLYTSTANLE